MITLIFESGETGEDKCHFYNLFPRKGVYRENFTKKPRFLPILPRIDFLLIFSAVILVLSVTTTPPTKPGKNFGFFPAVCVMKHGDFCGGGK